MRWGLPKDVVPIAVVVVIGAVMSILDTTVVNVALQTLRHDLGTSLTTVQWVSTAYLLSLAAVIPLTGWMAERFGPRKVWMLSVGAFVLTSALCGAAPTAGWLIGFRALQGAAGGMIMPIGMITLVQAAGPKRMGRVMSVVGVPMLLGPIFGPIIGGLVVDNLSWRWIFYINVPIGIVGLALAYRLLPRERATGRSAEAGQALPPLDRIGLLLLSPGVAALVFSLSEFGDRGTLADAVVWVPLVLGLAAITTFVIRARRIPNPLVEVRLFRRRGFSAAAGTVFFVGAALFGAMILLPLYFQIVRGQSPLHAGLLVAPQGLGAIVGMNMGGRLTDRIGGGRVVVGGLLITILGTVPFVFINADTSYLLLSAGLVLRGMGLGATMMPSMAAAYATLESSSDVPRATPTLNVLQRIGGSLGVALSSVLLQTRLNGVSARGPAAADPLAAAFAHAYVWTSLGLVVALVPALVLMREERRARNRAGAGAGADTGLAARPVIAA